MGVDSSSRSHCGSSVVASLSTNPLDLQNVCRVLEFLDSNDPGMNEARAMLDALMGPQRDIRALGFRDRIKQGTKYQQRQ